MNNYYFLITIGALILTCAWKLLNWAWLKPRKLEKMLRKQGLNGNSYRPIYGDMKDEFCMSKIAKQKPISFTNDFVARLHPFHHQQFTKYGENYFTWKGPIPAINVTQPELIREVYSRINEFQKPTSFGPLLQLLIPGIASLDGEKWVRRRKLINPAFHFEKIKLMLPAFHSSVMELIEKWENSMSKQGCCVELDVYPDIKNLTSDVISRAAFGSSFEDGRRVFELLIEQNQIIERLVKSLYIPGWKYVPTKTNRRLNEVNTKMRSLIKEMINDRKKAIDSGKPAVKDDILGIIMASNFKNDGHNTRFAMSLQDIVDECKLLYFAGYDSTSVLLVWTMILLSKHQDWQMKARDEVLGAFGKNSLPDVDGVNHLKLVTMILYEVLRLYPPAHLLSRAVHDSDKKLGHLTVPKGAMLTLEIYHAHHDPKLWGDDVNEFKPSRFSEGILNATKGNLSFFPFSGGPRICLGQNFAMVEAKMAVTIFLQRFTFELSPSYTHAPTPNLTLQPQHGAHLIIRRL